jgi:hypothetical protein
VFRLTCTVQPKAWPAGDAVTVADSEPIRTLHFEERAELGRRLGGRPRSPGQGVSRNSTWPWAPAIVQAAQMTAPMQAAAMSAPPDPVAAAGRHHSRDRCVIYQSATDPAGG